MTTPLRVSMFGRLTIQHDSDGACDLSSHKAKELLCFLLLHRDRSHDREHLADVLWGEQSSLQSRKYLRQSLWQLQNVLSDTMSRNSFLVVESDWVGLSSDLRLWVDAYQFEEQYASVAAIAGYHLTDHQADSLQNMLDLYKGDLLEGWYYDWCIYHRERFKSMYMLILEKMLDHAEARRRYETGMNYAMQILRHDRAHERTHRRLMRMYYLTGDRTTALRQFGICAAALKDELGVAPADATVELYEQIRADYLYSQRDGLAHPLRGAAVPRREAQHERQHLIAVQRSLTQALARVEQLLATLEHDMG